MLSNQRFHTDDGYAALASYTVRCDKQIWKTLGNMGKNHLI